jgi:TonB family protein
MALTAGLHAALIFWPGEAGRSGGGAGDAGVAGDEQAFVLVDAGAAAAVAAGGASSDSAASGTEGGAAMSPEEFSAVAEAQGAEALSEAQWSAAAWAAACEALPVRGGGFDALGGMSEALAHGIGAGGFAEFGGGRFFAGGGIGSGVVSGRVGRGAISVMFMPEPVYPELARRERREGMVELTVTVGASGRASSVEVARSSGHADLDAVARSTVLGMWRFGRDETGVARECVVQIAFSLRRG